MADERRVARVLPDQTADVYWAETQARNAWRWGGGVTGIRVKQSRRAERKRAKRRKKRGLEDLAVKILVNRPS